MGFDYLIVGAGFAGSVLAERLASQAGKTVLVCDRRDHIAGNAYDHYDGAGILVHKYGPHIFHTRSARVFDYLSQFTKWRPYQHRVLADVDGKLYPFPINRSTVSSYYGVYLRDDEECAAYLERLAERVERPANSEDVVVSKVGRELYEKFVQYYTRRHWGYDPSELDASVLARVAPRLNTDDRYFTDEFQAMPLDGYTPMFERMLSHPNITLRLGTDYRELLGRVSYKEMIYSGPIDEYFGYRFGKLPYLSLDFKFETHDKPYHLPAAVVNYTNSKDYDRVTEFKYLTGQTHPKTTVVYEYPVHSGGDPYYPIPRPQNAELYRKYKALADATPGVHFVGRLATYQYYNMDQVTAQALALYDKLSGARRTSADLEVLPKAS
ncbi:MAG TPA: UDP-galactopyranose mutase [Chloroflexota bacterium]|nr:UDP-galactopyranose mutase [Chloroflexota bacterium]